MSRAFFKALDIPEAGVNLGIGSGSHAEQVGHTMIAFEKLLRRERPGKNRDSPQILYVSRLFQGVGHTRG
jgi:hypothetical protein